jgi:hypothetical protein
MWWPADLKDVVFAQADQPGLVAAANVTQLQPGQVKISRGTLGVGHTSSIFAGKVIVNGISERAAFKLRDPSKTTIPQFFMVGSPRGSAL